MSLRTKLTLVGAALMAVVGITLGFYFYYYSRSLLQAELVGKGKYIAQSLSHNARYPIFTEDKILLSNLIDGVFEEPDAAYVLIVDRQGSLLMSRFRKEVQPQTAEAISARISNRPPAGDFTFNRDLPAAQGLYYHFAAPVFNTESGSPNPFADVLGILKNGAASQRIIGGVYVGISLAQLSLSLRRVLDISFLIFMITSVVGALFVYLLVERALRPLQLVTRTSGEIARGDFSKRVDAESKDEIGDLARSFNYMADSVQTLMQDLQEKKRQLEESNVALSNLNAELERRVRERTREIYQANQKLEALVSELEVANRVKSEFLANTSHELRTPLNAIIGFLALVKDETATNREEEMEYVQHAYDSGKHLLSLINDILDVAKIEAGKIELHPEEMEVGDVVSSAIELCRGLLQKKDLRLEVELEPGLSGIYADRARTIQVLSNLLSNSIKFTDSGGITVKGVSHAEKGFVQISVTDTGIGIPLKKEEQKLLFEKFRQVDNVTTRKVKGTGLGLSIAKSLVEMMGGTISITSEGQDRGTVVSFTLPVSGNQVPSTQSQEKRLAEGQFKEIVLVIENDARYRAFLRKSLEEGGYGVVEAGTAEQALACARQFKPQYVILDYALPYSSDATIRTASDFVAAAQNSQVMREARMLVLTGYDAKMVQDQLSKELDPPLPEIMEKPSNPDQLLSILKRAEQRA